MSGDWSQNIVITKVDGLYNCPGVTFPDGLHFTKKRPCSTLAFALQMSKTTEHIHRGSELVIDTNHSVELAALAGRTDRPLLSDTSAFHCVEKVGSPHQQTLSRKSQ
jgi:hypothetical protein